MINRGRALRWLMPLLVIGGAWLAFQPDTVEAIPVTVTVNTPVDDPLAGPDALCSLREAILAVNVDTGAGTTIDGCVVSAGATSYTINFAANYTINVDPVNDTPLPPITADIVTIDGLGGGGVKTELRGGNAVTNGLVLDGDGATIIGMDIRAFTQFAIAIDDSSSHVIGSTLVDEENILTLNGIGGLVINGANAADSLVIGNIIGSNPLSTNGQVGIIINGGANNNTIGGANPDEANTIASHPDAGVQIAGATTTGNAVIGNSIPLDAAVPAVGIELINAATGNEVRGNSISGGVIGILIDNSSNNTIGAPANQISTQQAAGIFTEGHAIYVTNASTGNFITQNQIGPLSGNGVTLIGVGTTGNQLTNNQIDTLIQRGVHVVSGAAGNTVGAGNVIQDASIAGILVDGADQTTITGSMIQNNIGSAATPGVALVSSLNAQVVGNTITGNAGIGINVLNAPSAILQGNTITGNGAEGISVSANNGTITANTISGNGTDGIAIVSGINNLFGSNSITANTELGIDLIAGTDPANGVTINDVGDGDTGANGLINYPVFTATSDGDSVNVAGSVEATGQYFIEMFANAAPDAPSGFGEGQTSVGFQTTAADGTFNFTLNGTGNLVGQFLTGTGSQTGVGSSEFSQAVLVNELIALFTANPVTGPAPLAVDFTDASTSTLPIVTWQWTFGDPAIPDSTVQNPSVIYNTPGIYTVWLVVFDSNGNADAFSLQIEVLPPLATETPIPTNTPAPTNTPFPPATNTPIPVATDTPIPTVTNTPIPTNTPLPTATNTLIPTNTPVPTNTALPTATDTPIPTNTPVPTNTPLPTATDTPIPTDTPVPTNTPIPTATNTLVPTTTPLASLTPLPQPTDLDDGELPEIELDKGPGAGDEIVIEISNNGDGDAFNVVLQEDLRPGVIYISASPGVPLCVEESGLVTCGLGTIPAGDSSTVTIQVETDGVDPLSGQTTVTADGVSPVTINAPYLIKLGQPPFAQPGAQITYTLRVINPTSNTVSNIRVTDQMPDGITIESVSATSGNVGVIGRNVSFSQGSLAPGGRITITLLTTLDEDADALEITNEACLTSDANPNPSCAQFGFFRAQQLPSTGERPLLTWVLLGFALASLGGLLMVTGLYLRRQN